MSFNNSQYTKNAFIDDATMQQPQFRNPPPNTRNIFSRNVITNPLTNPPPQNNSTSPVNIFNNKPIVINQSPPTNNVQSSSQQKNISFANSVQIAQQSSHPQNPFTKQNIQANSPNISNMFKRSANSSSVIINTTNNINSANHAINNQRNEITSQNLAAIFQNENKVQNPFPSNSTNNTPQQQANNIFTQNRPNQNNITFKPTTQIIHNSSVSNLAVKSPILSQLSNNAGTVSEEKSSFPQQQGNKSFAFIQQRQLINLMRTMKIGYRPQFNTIFSPFNFYHAKLMLTNLINNIRAVSKKNAYKENEELKVKVKESKYKNEILMMIKQINTTAAQFKHLKSNMKQLQNQASQIQAKLKQELFTRRQRKIQRLRWQHLGQTIAEQLDGLQDQLSNVIKPLFTAYQTGKNIQFYQPNTFSLQTAKSICKKMGNIESNTKNLTHQALSYYQQLSFHHQQNFIQAMSIIRLLLTCLEDLCIKFQELNQQFENQLHRQPRQFNQLIQKKVDLIKSKQICKVKQYMKAFSKSLQVPPFQNLKAFKAKTEKQTDL